MSLMSLSSNESGPRVFPMRLSLTPVATTKVDASSDSGWTNTKRQADDQPPWP